MIHRNGKTSETVGPTDNPEQAKDKIPGTPEEQ